MGLLQCVSHDHVHHSFQRYFWPECPRSYPVRFRDILSSVPEHNQSVT
jgi:hypothetical protein